MTRAAVGLGANQGQPRAQILRALDGLHALPETAIARVSSLYASRPWGRTGEPRYLNAVCLVDTGLPPRRLLDALQALEREAGRVDPGRPGRNGPRPLDLDLLTYGSACLDDPDLTVPHPSLAFRTFVLVPLSEIDAFWNHPVLGKTPGALLIGLSPVYDVQWMEPSPWNKS